LQEHNIGTAWLGAQDTATEGTWKWIGGPEAGTFQFANWREGEPNDVGNEDCGVIVQTDGGWNDANCDVESYAIIVEFGSELIQVPSEAPVVTNEHVDL